MLEVGLVLLLAAALLAVLFLWSHAGRLPRGMYEAGQLITGAAPSREHPPEFTIVTYNIGYASGLANNTATNPTADEYEANLQHMVAVLREVHPDILALQEVDYDSARSHRHDQPRIFSEALDLDYAAHAFNWNNRYVPFPYWPVTSHFGAVLSGQSVLTWLPIHSQSITVLPKPRENRFWYNAYYPDRLAQEVLIDLGGSRLRVINVHLEAYRQTAREAQADLLAQHIRQHMNEPLIVLGDFNAIPPWATEHVSEALDLVRGDRPFDTVLPTLLAIDGLQSATQPPRLDESLTYTFRSDDPRVAIDHILYNSHLRCLEARVLREARTASDHLPVLMRFQVIS